MRYINLSSSHTPCHPRDIFHVTVKIIFIHSQLEKKKWPHTGMNDCENYLDVGEKKKYGGCESWGLLIGGGRACAKRWWS